MIAKFYKDGERVAMQQCQCRRIMCITIESIVCQTKFPKKKKKNSGQSSYIFAFRENGESKTVRVIREDLTEDVRKWNA